MFRGRAYPPAAADLAFLQTSMTLSRLAHPRPQTSVITNDLNALLTSEPLPARAVRAFVVRSARVQCLEGELWVTGPGIDDEVLMRGESVTISRPGKVVIQALIAARMRIQHTD